MQELVSKNIIKNLLSNLSDSGKKFINSDGINKEIWFSIKSYENKIASLARLISFDEVCGCIYIDKSNNVYYSTNKLDKKAISDRNFSFLSSFFKESFNENNLKNKDGKSKFLKKIFQDNNFYFSDIFSRYSRMIQVSIAMISRKSNKNVIEIETLRILNLIQKDFYSFGGENYNSFDLLNHFHNLSEEISNYFKIIKEEEPSNIIKHKIIKMISSTRDYILDMTNIYNFSLSNDKERLIIESFKNDKFKRIVCNKNDNVHCEQRMFEGITNFNSRKKGFISNDVCRELKESVEEGRFVVSKICCGYCHFVFVSIGNLMKENTFYKLGNSCAFFNGWKSPYFFSNEIFKMIKEKIEEKIEFSSRLNWTELGPFIENSESEEMANIVLIPEAFV